MTSDISSPRAGSTEFERMAHYREQAAQFRQWAEEEPVSEARDGLLDIARQYERLASEIEAKSRSQPEVVGPVGKVTDKLALKLIWRPSVNNRIS